MALLETRDRFEAKPTWDEATGLYTQYGKTNFAPNTSGLTNPDAEYSTSYEQAVCLNSVSMIFVACRIARGFSRLLCTRGDHVYHIAPHSTRATELRPYYVRSALALAALATPHHHHVLGTYRNLGSSTRFGGERGFDRQGHESTWPTGCRINCAAGWSYNVCRMALEEM